MDTHGKLETENGNEWLFSHLGLACDDSAHRSRLSAKIIHANPKQAHNLPPSTPHTVMLMKIVFLL